LDDLPLITSHVLDNLPCIGQLTLLWTACLEQLVLTWTALLALDDLPLNLGLAVAELAGITELDELAELA